MALKNLGSSMSTSNSPFRLPTGAPNNKVSRLEGWELDIRN